MNSPVLAAGVVLIFIGLFTFFAVLLRLAWRARRSARLFIAVGSPEEARREQDNLEQVRAADLNVNAQF